MNTFKPVEIKQFYINRVASAMSQYFYKQIFEKIFQVLEGNTVINSFEGHKGRLGKVGGSLPREKMPSLEDYKNPKKDLRLPDIPQDILDKLGKKRKPLILKKGIIEKNKKHHPEVKIEEYSKILKDGIYSADVVFKTKANDDYYNFVYYDKNSYHPQILIELSETKDSYEIVNFYKLREKSLQEKLQKAIKRVDNEGDQVLIDIKRNLLKVGGLSNLEIDSIYIIAHPNIFLNPSVENSKDALLNAIKSGKVYYKDGAFRAERFSNAISTTLEKMGATFKNGAYYIDQALIPLEYIQALGIVQAQTVAKLATIRQVLSNLDLDGAGLDRYLEAVVQQMFKSLEVDILKSAQEKRVPVIELGIVSPKGKIPKAKKLEDYWKTQDEKLERLRKEKEKLKKQRTKDKKENKDTTSIEEKIDEIQSKIEEAKLDAFQQAPQVDVEIEDIELNEQARKIAQDYTYNMKYWVKKWEVKDTIKMRQDIVEMIQKGARQPEVYDYFRKRWKIAEDKAKFLAENESHLAASVIKKTEYEKLGCTKFKWGRSTSREKRERHLELAKEYGNKYGIGGKNIFYFDDPPIIDEKLNIRGLPRQIWNCKCQMLIVPPTLDEIINKRQKVNNSLLGKINGFFKGTQRNNNTWRYRRFGEGSSL